MLPTHNMKIQLSIFLVLAHVSIVLAGCASGLSECNTNQCYLPSNNACVNDIDGSKNLCPVAHKVCNKACYSPLSYHCANGQLQSGAESNNGGSSTTTGSSTPTTGSSTTGNSNNGNTNTCNKEGCPNNLCSCDGACFQSGQYNCAWDAFKNKNLLCQGSLSACNGKCYDATKQTCTNGNLVNKNGGTTGSSTTGSSTTGSSTTGSSTSGSSTSGVVVNPTPSPHGFPTQIADLRIINNCKTTLWFEGRYGGQGAPIPGEATTSRRALPGTFVDYTIPATGLGGTRFWAKYGCDANGRNCQIGDQMQYWPNPPGGCPAGGCTPPVDSLFEATWGCKPGAGCNSQNPTTWFDTSQVDGWTIPYKLTPLGDTSRCDCIGDKCGFAGVDASRLDLARCPRSEDVSNNGQFGNINVGGKTIAMNNIDLRIINDKNEVLGCMSPCKKLNWGAPYGLQQPEDKGATMWMCCPTPTPSDCSPSKGCISPLTCRNGPIEKTKFVAAVHDMAPGVYSYSYDDGVGLHACPAGIVKYTMEFCPSGASAYPGTL